MLTVLRFARGMRQVSVEQRRIVIDEQGRVTSVVLREPIHMTYDRRLIEAATHWRYEPARAYGTAVKYRKVIEVNVR